MTALALNAFERSEQALGRSFVLSAIIHIALAAVLFLGVRWQSHAPETVTVDLVEAPPPAPAPVAEAPKPPPQVEPQVKPEPPPVRKPEIAMPEKKKVVKEPPKKAPPPKPKQDLEFQRQLKEQMALEQKQRQERELRDLLARQQADAARQAAAARNKALNEYIGRIQGQIRRNIPESALEGIPGNPAAIFDVVQIPTGEVISVRIRKSSGYPRYDDAIERAILKASPLPLPPSREMFQRALELTFRPLDK
jgi:colicin import membrane protein